MNDPLAPCDEFECVSCGRHIVSLPRRDPPPTQCATCQWIDEFIEAGEREAMRKRLCE